MAEVKLKKAEKINKERFEKFKQIKLEVYDTSSSNLINNDHTFLAKDELCLGSLKLVYIGVYDYILQKYI